MLPASLHRLIRSAFPELRALPQPWPLYLVSLEKVSMGKFTAKVSLPGPGAPDTVKQELKIFVDGAEVETKVRDVKAGDSPLIEIKDLPEDKPVRLELREIDDANPPNVSLEPSVLEFTPHDTVPPPTPGTMSVELVEQEEEQPAA